MDKIRFYTCVIYIAPDFSTLSINENNFFDVLMEQISPVQNGTLFFTCGNYNSRICDMDDFITEIDNPTCVM